MAIVSTAQLANILPKMIVPAKLTQVDRGVMKKLVRVIPLPDGEGTAVNQPKYGTLTAYAGTDGVDVAQGQLLTDSNLAITPGFIAVQVILSDRVLRQAGEPVLRQVGVIMADAIEKKRDADLLTLISGAGSAIPSAGNTGTLKMGHLKASMANILGNTTEVGINAGPICAVLHPFSWHDIAENAIGLTSGGVTYPIPPGLSGEIAQNYEPLGRVFGLTGGAYLDTNITAAAATHNGVFARDFAIYVPHIAMETKKERDESLGGGAWELNVYSWYGQAEYQDAWVRLVDGNGLAPTA